MLTVLNIQNGFWTDISYERHVRHHNIHLFFERVESLKTKFECEIEKLTAELTKLNKKNRRK